MPFCLQDVSSGRGFFNNAFDSDARSYFSAAGITPASATPTAYDQAATFNGTNQYLSCAFSTLGASFSVSAWINPSVISDYRLLVSGNTNGDFNVSIDPSGRVNAGSAYISNDITSSTSLVANQWYNVVVTGDGSFLKIYINGNNVATASQTKAYPITSSIQINGINGLNYLFNGSIAGVGYWTSALNLAQVSDLYNGGIGRSPSYICFQSSYSIYLVSYWALNETSGASVYVDFNEVHNLTPYNTPTNSVGPIATTTASSQSLINTFVKGIKRLGLWNSMVCWPLRSSQNASSTQTAYSLGGLGSYNGSLVNNPTYASQGIYSGSNSGFLNTNYNLNFYNSAYSVLGVCRFDSNYSIVVPRIFGQNNSAPCIYNISSPATSSVGAMWNGSNNYNVIPSADWTQRTFSGLSNNGSGTSLGTINGNYQTSTTPTTPPFTYQLHFMKGEIWNWSGDASFAALVNTNLNQSTIELVRSLYKSTLGLGLSLA